MRSGAAITVLSLLVLVVPVRCELEVIGSGYGRTGTDSLRVALNTLGFKTYHMKEIIENQLSSHVKTWHKQAENKCADVHAMKALFEDHGYTAAVDFPASMCWETLMKVYPNAKVVHTRRTSADVWWASASDSILSLGNLFPFNVMNRVVPFFVQHKEMVDAMWSNLLNKPVSSDEPGFPGIHKADFLERYEANNERVTSVVPHKRLLVHDHAHGWDRLCAFLGKAVPLDPYPRVNSRAEFKTFVRNLGLGIGCAGVTALVTMLLAVKWLSNLFTGARDTKIKGA